MAKRPKLVKGAQSQHRHGLSDPICSMIVAKWLFLFHTDTMANEIRIFRETKIGEGFVPARYLAPGEDEYRIRNQQLRKAGKEPDSFRHLSTHELEVLVRNNNTCSDWSKFLVRDPFYPELVRNNIFSGLIRISKLERVSLEHHDLTMEAGISNSRLIACDIGDNCVISHCAYLSHYIIDDHCILINNAEIQVSNHAKFGNGVVMENEDPSIRVTLDIMNENGGRWIYPFNGMLTGDAWLWAKFRDRKSLLARFEAMTDALVDRRLGRYGYIGRASVLKHNRIIKDVWIGNCAYIKGTNKLKNLTINSSEEAHTQIGEGVELVNGILGYGCRVFYGCKAVRFVTCDNSALKYGARLIHSVLGENSTVSCCEILNNLIFPAHEQHHNTSFLIASLVKGQSNMAAGATIGSNHNSRAPDGEIEAGRGFWPGLCTSVKHSSRFASFCLLSKSDYKHELDIRFPFCLVDNDEKEGRLKLAPAWWWYANSFALMRNEHKLKDRDRRPDTRIRFIYKPLAADTAAEILQALAILEEATGNAAREAGFYPKEALEPQVAGARILSTMHDPLPFEVFVKGFEHSNRPQEVLKPARAWVSYREMLLWFAATSLLPLLDHGQGEETTTNLYDYFDSLSRNAGGQGLATMWENAGGFLVRFDRLESLMAQIESGAIADWEGVHDAYRRLSEIYQHDAAAFAWHVLGYLSLSPEQGSLSRTAHPFLAPDRASFVRLIKEALSLSHELAKRIRESRLKDWENPFRAATFRNREEMLAVHGEPEHNRTLNELVEEIRKTGDRIRQLQNQLGE